MTFYDITLPLSAETPVWPGDPQIETGSASSIAGGDGCNLTRIALSSHSGTHIDAPRHYLEEGATIDELPFAPFIGPAVVVESTATALVGAADLLRAAAAGAERILVKTANSHRRGNRFDSRFIALSEEGARLLIDSGVRLVGIDGPSIECYGGNGDIHRLLLQSGIVIAEYLNLHDVPPGNYDLICLPLRLQGGDGAPARALLVDRREPLPIDLHTTRWPLS